MSSHADQTNQLVLHSADSHLFTTSFSPNRFCLRKIGSFAAAAADFGRLIALGHGTVRAFNSRAYCYASLGEFDRAVADYTEAIQVRR